jgi:hypothetical protein
LLLLLVLQGAASGQQPVSTWVIGGASGERWAQVAERAIALDDSARPGAIQPLEIPPGVNVLRGLVRATGAATQRNIFGYQWAFTKDPARLEIDNQLVGWNPRLWGIDVAAMRGLIDGDELTASFSHLPRVDGRPNAEVFFTLDLGVGIPVDSIVFFPPQSGFTDDNQRQRNVFPVAYEVTRTNTPLDWLIFEDETLATGSPGYHPLAEMVGSTFSNNTSIVSLTPELSFTRFLRLKFGRVTSLGILAEVQVFGHGFPEVTRYVSQPHSFGSPVSLGKITWGFTKYRRLSSDEVVEDPTAPVQLLVQTRAGTKPDPLNYFIFDDLRRLLQVDRQAYFDAPPVLNAGDAGAPGFRASRSDDIDNWNPWSIAYVASGDEIRSSDGREFFQFRFEITTADPLAFGVLDSLAFEVSPLLADRVLAEVSLAGQPSDRPGILQVPLGVDTLLVYDIRTVFGAGRRPGFNGIELDVPPGARFLELEIDGAPAREGVDFTFRAEDNLFRFTFPQLIAEDTAFRVRYRSAIFQSSLFLGGQLLNTDSQTVLLPQSIEAGDARDDVASNGIQVVASSARLSILGALRLSSPVLTPNGDDVNDAVAVSFDLFGIDRAAMKVEVYDLAGRRLVALLDDIGEAGPYRPTWDGRDTQGKIAAPGLYVLRVEVKVDEDTFTKSTPIAVSY